jgi:hypothetical protein
MNESSESEQQQCHWISNTHWDREWRFSAQRTRYKLVQMIDILLDTFEKHPDFKHFHMDSQTLPIQDYLEIRPEKEDRIRELVTDGRLAIGPWFCLPDEYCVGGESLVRNLLLGHRIARRFGAVSKTGYSPFGWGQISQMPQLYKGFGIDMMSFYRGTHTLAAKNSEYWWDGPDGTRILVSRLAPRPRYNVWYILQRSAYWNFKNVDGRHVSWTRIGGPFRLMDEGNEALDSQYVHPQYEYHAENIPARARQTIDEQTGHWTTPHRFWSAGHDTSFPDPREIQMIADCQKALGGEASVFHSTVTAWQDGVKERAAKINLPVVEGEMHHPASPGSSSELIGWIISSRTYIKQENFRTERELVNYAEPLSVISAMLGTDYPQSFLDTAYNWLLQNHGHDSIAGCSRDVIHEDMMYRYRQAREIGSCLVEQGMMEICRSIDCSDWNPCEMAVVVYNPASFVRSETMPVMIDIPSEWDADGFKIVDEAGTAVPMQMDRVQSPISPLFFNNSDVVNVVPSSRCRVWVTFPDVPAMGYRTFKVVPTKVVSKITTGCQPQSMLTGAQSMANDFVEVSINANGSLDILHKETGKLHSGLGYFRNSSETGDPWIHVPVETDEIFTTLNERARISLICDGGVTCTFRIAFDWALPESSTLDDKARSSHTKAYPIVTEVTLRQGQPWVEVETTVDNTVENHYLQVCFPSDIASDTVMAQGQFDVVERSMLKPDYSLYYEEPQTEQPMNSFIDISDGKTGLALLNEGLKAYTPNDDARRTLNISLLRCFPMKICAMDDRTDYTRTDNGGQCPGKHTFRYGIMPHAGSWKDASLWKQADRFTLPFVPAQLGPTSHGSAPRQKSFLDIDGEHVHLSGIKRSENNDAWIVRLFNSDDRESTAAVTLNGGRIGQSSKLSPTERVSSEFTLPNVDQPCWSMVQQVSLEEVPEVDLSPAENGSVQVVLGPKQIVTLAFKG